MGRRAKGVLGLSLRFRVDDHEVGIAILVLHGPDLLGLRVHLDAVVVSGNGVGVDHIAVEFVFNNRAALAVGAIGSRSIAVAYED